MARMDNYFAISLCQEEQMKNKELQARLFEMESRLLGGKCLIPAGFIEWEAVRQLSCPWDE